MLGFLNDALAALCFWQTWGVTGPDKGMGWKFWCCTRLHRQDPLRLLSAETADEQKLLVSARLDSRGWKPAVENIQLRA